MKQNYQKLLDETIARAEKNHEAAARRAVRIVLNICRTISGSRYFITIRIFTPRRSTACAQKSSGA